jgi:hypothetical protein
MKLKKLIPVSILSGAALLGASAISHHVITNGLISKGGEFDDLWIATTPETFIADEISTKPRRLPTAEMSGDYNAPARIEVERTWDVFSEISFLYWQAREEGLDFGITVPNHALTLPAFPNDGGELVEMEFKYKPGFKVAAGLNLTHDQWSLTAAYTWFHSSTEKNHAAPDTGYSHSTWLTPVNDGVVLDQKAHWNLHVAFLDFQMARAYFTGKNLSFEPNLGLRLGWIDQHFRVHHVVNGLAFPITVKNKSDSWGVGPILGLKTNWLLGRGTRLFGNIAGSVLYTHYKVRLEENNLNIHNKVGYLRPAVETALGFGWGAYCCQEKYHVDLSAAYNFNVYWNQNMMRQLKDVEASQAGAGAGDLYLQGLTAKVRFDF